MIPKKLILTEIFDELTEYDFTKPKTVYRVKDETIVRQGISYALFGDKTRVQGRVEFEFEANDHTYVVCRDFFEKSSTVTEDGRIYPEEAGDKKLADIVGLDESRWNTFAVASKHETFNALFGDPESFIPNILQSLSLNNRTINTAAENYGTELQALRGNIKYLKSIPEKDLETLQQEVEAAEREVAEVKDEINAIIARINTGEYTKSCQEKLSEVEAEIGFLETKTGSAAYTRKLLEDSDHITSQLGMLHRVADVIKENLELRDQIDTGNDGLAVKRTEIENGKKALDTKESAFSYVSDQVKALNTALDELILENTLNGKSDSVILGEAEKTFANVTARLAELRSVEQDLASRMDVAIESFNAALISLEETHIASTRKKTIREGACFETMLDEKNRYLQDMRIVSAANSSDLTELKKNIEYNNLLLQKSVDRIRALIPTGSISDIMNECNLAEERKLSVYRNQIICAGLIKDIEAIDKKIDENLEANRDRRDTVSALAATKETISQYVEKNQGALDEIEKYVERLKTDLRFFLESDNIEYGSICPLCGSSVTDKHDTESEKADISAEIKEQEAKATAIRTTLDDYKAKMKDLTAKIDAFMATITAGEKYVSSLESTKAVKAAALARIFKEEEVLTLDGLTVKMEDTIHEVNRLTEILQEARELAATEIIARENQKALAAMYDANMGNFQSNETHFIEQNTARLADFTEGYAVFKEELNGERAIDLLSGLLENEAKEDACLKKLGEIARGKETVYDALTKVREEMRQLESRYITVQRDGKDYSYGQLCVYFAGLQYTSVIGEIRLQEQTKQNLQDEIVALKKVLDDKEKAVLEEETSIDKLLDRFNVNSEFLDIVRADEEYDTKLLDKYDIQTLEKTILSEEQYVELKAKLADFEKQTADLAAKKNALLYIIEANQVELEELWKNKNALGTLRTRLAAKEKALTEVTAQYLYTQAIKAQVEGIQKEIIATESARDNALSLLKNNTLLFVKTANDAIKSFLPRYGLSYEKGTLKFTGLKTGQGNMEKLEDSVYTILTICLINSVREIVGISMHISAPIRIVHVNEKGTEFPVKIKEKLLTFALRNGLILMFHK